MKITCPYCTAKIELEEVLRDTIILQAFKMLPEFGPYGRLVFEYAELFRIGPPFNARKLVRILTEVKEFFQGHFEFQKRRYEISRDGLAVALRTVCNAQIKSGLQNHNYLKKVAIAIAEEEGAKRSRGDERKLRERESGAQDRAGGGLGRWSVGDLPGKIEDLLQKIDG